MVFGDAEQCPLTASVASRRSYDVLIALEIGKLCGTTIPGHALDRLARIVSFDFFGRRVVRGKASAARGGDTTGCRLCGVATAYRLEIKTHQAKRGFSPLILIDGARPFRVRPQQRWMSALRNYLQQF